MNSEIANLLARLPPAEEELGDGIVLTGRLLPRAPNEVNVLSGGFCFTFFLKDVLAIEPIGIEELEKQFASKEEVRVLVRRHAPILNILPGQLYSGLLTRQRPFALSVRSAALTLRIANRFRTMEQEFLSRHSLKRP